MADVVVQQPIRSVYKDGSIVVSNVKSKVDNSTTSYSVINAWYDGTPMDDSKVDQWGVYTKYKATGEYLRENKPQWGELFLEVDTVADLRAMSTYNQFLVKIGYYKGVRLNGYYNRGDIPKSQDYYISTTTQQDDGASIIVIDGLKLEHKFIDYVTPRSFGYFGDGDALPFLKKMHIYANQNKIEVIADGELNILSSGTIIIDTTSDYSRAILNVDISVRDNTKQLFEFSSAETKEFQTIDISNQSYKDSIVSRMKRGCIYIPELAPYKDKFLVFEDSGQVDAIRLNSNGTEQSRSYLMDCTAVLDGGKLSTPIREDFSNLTRIKYYNITDNIIFKPGIVKYSGNNASSSYLAPTYYIHRSNFTFADALIQDLNTNPVKNVINQIKMDYSYNVVFKNVKAQAIKDNSGGSTYFLNPYMCCNTLMDNVIAENDDNSWGAIGSNYWKNVTIINSKLNRIDGHFGLFNLRIINSHIGFRGIRAIGGGYLDILNCSARCQDLINIREDYGSKWDGAIKIDNLNWQLINTTSAHSLVRYTVFDYDFQMQKKFADSIRIENIKIDASFVTSGVALVRAIEWGGVTTKNIRFPVEILVKDVYNTSEINCQFLVFISSNGNWPYYKVPTYIGGTFSPVTNRYRTNCNITIDNVIGNRELLNLGIPYSTYGISEGSIIPRFIIKNTRLLADIGALKGEVYVDNCEVSRFIAYNGTGYMQGILKFNSCIIKPLGSTTAFINHYNIPPAYSKFIGCTIYSPLNGNLENASNINKFYAGIFDVNTLVKCTHVGTEMAEDLKASLSANSTFLKKLFSKSKEEVDTI